MNQNVHQMIQALGSHFGKRHESDGAEEAWLYGMYQNLKGYPSEVLKTATEQIVATREERTFPQVAEIKKVCDGLMRVRTFAVKFEDAAPVTLSASERKLANDMAVEQQLRIDAAKAWREKVTASHGSVENFLKATRPRNFWEA